MKSKKPTFFIAIAIVIIISILHFATVLKPFEDAVIKALSPVLTSLYSTSSNIRVFYKQQIDKRNLSNEIQQLKIKNNTLTQENIQLKILKDENKILRNYLNFVDKNKFNYTLSNIISRSNFLTASNKKYVIDKGKKQGIKKGLVVLNNEGMVVGKVTKIKDNSSEICLSIDKNCKFAATIQNNNRTAGITFGELNLTIKMDFIPQTEELRLGYTIITSGLEENIPRGLIIGKITQIHQENNDVWQSASIEPLIDAEDLKIVSILLPQ